MTQTLSFRVDKSIASVIKETKQGVINKTINPAELVLAVKKAEKFCKQVFKDAEGQKIKKDGERLLKEYQQEHASLHDGISKLSSYTNTSFDYSNVDHPELQELLKIQKVVDERVKTLKSELELAMKNHMKESDPLKGGTFKVPPSEGVVKRGIKENDYVFEVIPNGEEPIEYHLPKMEKLYLSRFSVK
jgi:hypothetical protein